METKEDKEDNEKLMIRYLLGEMSEPEQSQIEERYFHDQDFYIQLLAVEEELMSDYARGHLSPPERAQFEQHFLASPRRQQKYESAKDWRDFISSASLPATVSPGQERPSWLRHLRFSSPVFQVALAAAMLLLIAGGGWLMVQTRGLQDQLKQSETQRAALEQQIQEARRQAAAELARQQNELAQLKLPTSESPGAEPRMVSFVLTAGRTRGIDKEQKLSIPSNAENVRLQLYFDFEARHYPTYSVELKPVAGEKLWSQGHLKARAGRSGGVVELILPASSLTKRDYLMFLNGVTAAGESELVEQYSFKVDKK